MQTDSSRALVFTVHSNDRPTHQSGNDTDNCGKMVKLCNQKKYKLDLQ